MSKGSLLYHFPTKDDLVRGMVVRLIERFEEDVEARRDEGSGGWTEEPREVAVDAALLATVANNPKLLDPLRERYEVWQRRVEDDGLDPSVGTLLRRTACGLPRCSASRRPTGSSKRVCCGS
jgi:AcrR family transcriptional regulator